MFSQFQSSYQRVETSLRRLTESIAAYNPSTAAADELLVADSVVNENLAQCKSVPKVDSHVQTDAKCLSGSAPAKAFTHRGAQTNLRGSG